MNEAARVGGHDDTAIVALLAEQARTEKVDHRGGAMLLVREAASGSHHERLASLVDDPTAVVIVGTIDDVVVGYATMQAEPLDDESILGRIDELYVMADARGVGVGEAIMDQLESTAAGWGCRGLDAIALPGDRATKNFFETFGLKARAIVVHRNLGN